MTYELAKELKDAGFSVEHETEVYNHVDEKGNPCSGLIMTACRVPTLSELIDACPKKIPALAAFVSEGYLAVEATDNGWKAGYDRAHEYEGNWFDHDYEGKTPEEAVARLWLALNKKP